MDVITGDSRVRKKDKTANEPIQFYVAKNRQPFEIVVNSVNKDEVNGYLATPKVEAVRQ